MTSSRFPAGIVRPLILLVLIGFLLGTAGCTGPSTGSDPSGQTMDSALAPGNETNASSLSEDLTRGVQGFVARPVKLLDRSTHGSATIPVVMTTGTGTAPALSAKGNDVNMTNEQLQTETLLPQ